MNTVFFLASTTGAGSIVRALIFGIFLGAALTLGGFADPRRIKNALSLRDKNLILSFLWMLLGALLFYKIGVASGMISGVRFPESSLAATLLGGLLCGAGFSLARFSPLGALCALAHGRLAAVAVFAGTFVALIVHRRFGGEIARFFSARDIALGQASAGGTFFNPANPALWAAGFLLLLILAVFFALRKQ